jgi:hypothetical protein
LETITLELMVGQGTVSASTTATIHNVAPTIENPQLASAP